jgi:hypothetical protein
MHGTVVRTVDMRTGYQDFGWKTWNHSEDLGLDGRITSAVLRKQGEKVWTEFIWLRIGTNGGL